jgi:FkbM family methyltransferase
MNIYDKVNLKYEHAGPQVIADIGTNVGVEAMKLFEVYPNAKMVLIEPQASNCDRLEAYIREKNLSSWSVSRCAVDTATGRKEFGFHRFMQDGRLNGSLDPFNWRKWNYEGTVSVETKRLGDICQHPTIIKMDIERHEYVVLPEICQNPSIKIMYVELHGPCYPLDIVDFVENCIAGTGLEVTGWYRVEQHQTYKVGEDDVVSKIEPQRGIGDGEDRTIIIERARYSPT